MGNYCIRIRGESMKYKGTRQLLTGILTVMLTIPVVVGLASPIRTQAASKVGVQYRFADGEEHEAKNRVGIRSEIGRASCRERV